MIATPAKPDNHGIGYDIGLREGKRSARESADFAASYVLKSVPSISAAKALVILKALGSLGAVAIISPADLMQIPGDGPELSQKITAACEKIFG